MEIGKSILSAKGLSVGYPEKGTHKVVASGIDINLQAGKITTLIGANGAGKSTLLKTLTGSLRPLSGQIVLHDKRLADYSLPEMAQQLAVVLTEKLPAGNLSVYELVALGRQPYTNWLGQLTEADKQIIDKALQQTKTKQLSQQKYFEISDGQLQKVLIARALAQDTPVIILDEPTTHLDLLHKVQVLRLLKNLARNHNKCILYSTHDLELALQLSDSIIIMSGDTTTQGTPAALIESSAFDTLFGDTVKFDTQSGRFLFDA